MKSLGPIAAVALALALPSGIAVAQQSNVRTGRSTAQSLSAQDFVDQVADGTKFELQSAHIALRKAQDPAVKRFAERVINDHTKLERQLERTARSDKNIQYPTNPQITADQQSKIDQLDNASGKDFDKTFVNMMADDHENDINLFKSYEASGTDSKLKAFARRGLPKIESHLRKIDKLQANENKS